MELKKLRRSKSEDAGRWFDIGDGSSLCLRSTNYGPYRTAMVLARRPYRAQLKRGTMDEKKDMEITARCLSDHIVVDWKGIEENGTPTPFSPDVCFRAIVEYQRFGDIIIDLASDQDNFDASEDLDSLDAAKKNSASS